MRKAWVLDTSTKGTGATMVPLDRVLRKPSGHEQPIFVPPPPRPKPDSAPEPRRPRVFKVVDIATRQVVAQDADARAVVDVLGDVRSIVDVSVYVWQPNSDKWRLLSFDERRAFWDLRAGAQPSADSAA
jgi:hypothetical protein